MMGESARVDRKDGWHVHVNTDSCLPIHENPHRSPQINPVDTYTIETITVSA